MPTQEQRLRMVNAPLGDDVFKTDPTVNRLEQEIASLFGKEAAMITSSGTMANLISVMLSCRYKGDALMLGRKTHIFNWERGNAAAVANVMPIPIANNADGTLDLEEIL